jgi:hypothetical protein
LYVFVSSAGSGLKALLFVIGLSNIFKGLFLAIGIEKVFDTQSAFLIGTPN